MGVDGVLVDGGDADRAEELARRIGVPVVAEAPDGALVLVFGAARVELRTIGPSSVGPVFVDLKSPVVERRSSEAGSARSPLARALGATKGRRPLVVDATAGLGVDAALIARLGCEVLALDRSPVVAELWRDALVRDTPVALRFAEADARDLLPKLAQQGAAPDVVYLDPMFPSRKKRALVKKEMQVLQRALDDAPADGAAVLAVAREFAARVVVKRPKGADALGDKPSSVVPAGNVRFDLYVA